jgi:hypothetical protein
MNLRFIDEPELDFASGAHIDPRFGITNYGPFDRDQPSPAQTIRVGIVGASEGIEGVAQWLEKCAAGIPAKHSRQPNLFPQFPGFGDDSPFKSRLVLESREQRTISNADVADLSRIADADRLVEEGVGLVLSGVRYLAKETSAEVIVCAIPRQLLDLLADREQPQDGSSVDDSPSGAKRNFRSLLKARAMEFDRPIQLVLPATYGARASRRRRSSRGRTRALQDEATRAWNFFIALYYKRRGIPWRLPRSFADLTTCYVGIAFYRSLDEERLETSVAQVFDERGAGFIVRGGAATFEKDDRTPHLSGEDMTQMLMGAIGKYREEHKAYPARVVIHKTSRYSDAERLGCLEAMKQMRIDQADLLSFRRSFARLFRTGAYPPLRGTLWSLDDSLHVLYTRGSVDFFQTYPGLYVPLPLELELDTVEQGPELLARETLALTKMNWNSTQFDHAEPITLEAASRVGSILKHLTEGDPIQERYSFYM